MEPDAGAAAQDDVGPRQPGDHLDPARTQAKVLRVLQNGEVEPVGAERTITVDVRVVVPPSVPRPRSPATDRLGRGGARMDCRAAVGEAERRELAAG